MNALKQALSMDAKDRAVEEQRWLPLLKIEEVGCHG